MRPTDFEFRGWIVSIEIDRAENCFSGHADLHYDGNYKCRLVLATTSLDDSSARWELESRARAFIDDWIMRPHTGTTGFQDL